jgi:hypothetical protein
LRILAILRSENASLVKALLDAGHDIIMPDEYAQIYARMGIAVDSAVYPGNPDGAPGVFRDTVYNKVSAVAGVAPRVIDAVRRVRPDAVVVWTDAPTLPRLTVMTARADNIPTFEVTHGAFNTYRQGHFECDSYVDYILAPGQEEADFRSFYGSSAKVIITGKPSLDWIYSADREEARETLRERFAITTKRPLILYAMTWRHPFSTWERDTDLGEFDVLQAHRDLLDICNPFLVIKPHYCMASDAHIARIHKLCSEAGITDFGIVVGPTEYTLPAFDLIVSHKSSMLVESVLLAIPCVGFDFREYNDFAFYAGRGIEWCAQRDKLKHAMASCLLDSRVKDRLATERLTAQPYFNGPNDGHAAERCVQQIEQIVEQRRAA